MGEDIKGDHFKSMKNINKEMEDFVIEFFAQADSKIGKSSFTRDIVHKDTGMGAISPAPVLIPNHLKKLTHVLIPVNIPKQIQKEQTWGIVTRRPKG
jgi:phosphoribosylamine-glycine ligase